MFFLQMKAFSLSCPGKAYKIIFLAMLIYSERIYMFYISPSLLRMWLHAFALSK